MSHRRSTTTQTHHDAQAMHERQGAVRALLRRPLLTSSNTDAELFSLVRRHGDWLQNWFARHPGWVLQVASDLIRLRKTPAALHDASRPARTAKPDQVLSKRAYVILCLALAAVERSDRQTTLGELASQVSMASRQDEVLAERDMVIDMGRMEHRRDLVQAIRVLLDLDVMRRVDGDEQAFVANDKVDALYTINRPALASMLVVRRGPSTIHDGRFEDRVQAALDESIPTTEDARNRQVRMNLFRRLLDDPVLYYVDLSEDELSYLHSQRGRIVAELETATGMIAEIRREGVALADPTGEATDMKLSEDGTDGHLALLLAEFLAQRARDQPGAPVTLAELERKTTDCIATHRHHWRRDVREPGAAILLTRQTLDRLLSLDLVTVEGTHVTPRPAIGRYALAPTGIDNQAQDTSDLWEAS